MRKIGVFTASVALLGAVLIAAASAESATQDARITRHGAFFHYEAAVAQSADRGWTPERMAAAEPRAMIRQGRAIGPVVGTSTPEPAGAIPARTSDGVAVATDSSSTPSDVAASSVGYDYPFPFSRFEVPGLTSYTSFPYSAIGKIFGHDVNGDYECSGAAVVSSSRSVVFTAGHCVYDAGVWADDLIFVPAYRDGSTPFGSFAMTDAWATNGWIHKGDYRGDFAAVVVGANTSGQTVGNAVGELGFTWSQSRTQHWMAVGYPAAAPFNGSRQQICAASVAAVDPHYRRRAPSAIGCDQTPGSSGGPWIVDFGTRSYLNSVTSYSLRGVPDALFGPYFGELAHGVLGCAEDGTC